MRRAALAALAALSVGCGSKTDPGGGTDTLTALVEVRFSPADRTTIEVDLRSAANNPVVGATVTLDDVDRGNQASAVEESPGSYRGGFDGYARTVAIELSTPDGDRLNAQLEGPAPHVLTRPTDGAIVRRGDFDSLKVIWAAESDAEAAEVEAGDGEPVRRDGDPGEAELPLGPLLDGPQTLTVRRETTVDLAGGLPGSKMRSRYETRIQFTLEP